MKRKVSRVAELLGEWCERHGAESLPWRTAIEPWSVLIAAVLLRKTTTKQVSEVYGKFLAKFPVASISSFTEALPFLMKPLTTASRTSSTSL